MPEATEPEATESVERRPDGYRGLTISEDHELRQLTWFSKVGHMSETARARLSELRQLDRREEVRNPKPDPSVVEDRSRTLPALQYDSASSLSCPNCGYQLSSRRDGSLSPPVPE